MTKGLKNLSLSVTMLGILGTGGAAPAQEDKAEKAEKATPSEAVGRGLAERHKECLGFFSAKDEENFSKCLSPGVVSEFVDSGQPRATGARQSVERNARPMWTAFPDGKMEPQLILVNGSNLLSIDLFTGTNQGSFLGAPPTGKKVGVYLVNVLQVDPAKRTGRKISTVVDFGTIFGQLGLSPAPHRPALTTGWPQQLVVVAGGGATERANVAHWRKGQEVWNQHDAAKVMADYADDAAFHDSGTPADIKGKADIEGGMQVYWTAFPDIKGRLTSVWGAGDWVVSVGSAVGTNTAAAPQMGIAEKTGKKVKLNLVEVVRYDAGKIKEHWIFYNGMAMAKQLGLIPPPGGAPKKS